MAVDFRPELILKSIVYCALADCPRSTFCLRYLAYKASAPFWTHAFVDPRIQSTEQGCPQYLSNEVQRMGRGFRASMQLVRYGSISTFRGRIADELGCGRSHFYRYATGEYPLTLEQQAIVRSVFEEFDVNKEDLFDAYEDAYYLPY